MSKNPFDHSLFIGYVYEVTPQYVRVHFPSSILLNSFNRGDENFEGGLVGTYVTVEGETHGFLGRILELSMPESERLDLTEKAFQNQSFHPTAKIEVLLSFNHFTPDEAKRGLDNFPHVGAKTFACSAEYMQEYIQKFGVRNDGKTEVPLVELGTLTSSERAKVRVSQQALFARHCAIVGTTGGGKSWSTAHLLHEIIQSGNKAILLDATGEFEPLDKHSMVTTENIGNGSSFHYSQLTVDDLFMLVRPSGQVQAPVLLDAVKSLKIQSSSGAFDEIYKKEGTSIDDYEALYEEHIAFVEDGLLGLNITVLARQVEEECIWPTDRQYPRRFGGRNDNLRSNSVSLLTRINNLVNNTTYGSLFAFKKAFNEASDLSTKIAQFLESENCILRINFKDVPFEFQAREILANAIGKLLLKHARNNKFKTRPVVLFIDEAHQYLNKSVQDEYFTSRPLDCIDQIAKEGRKYGLFLCLSTQMPRDIPAGTLSQMGTFLVHRLINHFDKEAVINACSSANKSVLSFLPVLGEGEAILLGVDFPMPLALRVNKPAIPPNSETPRFRMVGNES